jgi:hypothetical protein
LEITSFQVPNSKFQVPDSKRQVPIIFGVPNRGDLWMHFHLTADSANKRAGIVVFYQKDHSCYNNKSAFAMIDLSTHYMGIPLRNPIIIGSSSLVSHPDMLKKLEEAGAAAVVYKSLFEEQIHLESIQLEDEMTEYADRNAEMISIFPKLQHAGPEEFLLNLREARSQLSIPLIASLNCIYTETWVEYAKLIEQTGVDGLELNFYAQRC